MVQFPGLFHTVSAVYGCGYLGGMLSVGFLMLGNLFSLEPPIPVTGIFLLPWPHYTYFD